MWISYYATYYILQKSKVFSCGKNAIFCCSEDSCNVSICKKCFNDLNSNDITFIKSNNNVSSNNIEDESDNASIQSSNYSEIDEVQNINDDQEQHNSNEESNNILTKDNFYDFLTLTFPTNGIMDELLESENQ